MSTIRFLGIETLAAALILLPIMAVLGKIYFQNGKRTWGAVLFVLYLSAVYAIVGLPVVDYCRIHLSVNLIPLVNMAEDFRNAMLNILLFVPLGFFLPILWEQFRKIRKTLGFGLCMTLTIEILQLFTFRATDVNDLLTNLAGTLIGYALAMAGIKKLPLSVPEAKRKTEPYFLCILVFLVMFFIQPFLARKLWEMVL